MHTDQVLTSPPPSCCLPPRRPPRPPARLPPPPLRLPRLRPRPIRPPPATSAPSSSSMSTSTVMASSLHDAGAAATGRTRARVLDKRKRVCIERLRAATLPDARVCLRACSGRAAAAAAPPCHALGLLALLLEHALGGLATPGTAGSLGGACRLAPGGVHAPLRVRARGTAVHEQDAPSTCAAAPVAVPAQLTIISCRSSASSTAPQKDEQLVGVSTAQGAARACMPARWRLPHEPLTQQVRLLLAEHQHDAACSQHRHSDAPSSVSRACCCCDSPAAAVCTHR